MSTNLNISNEKNKSSFPRKGAEDISREKILTLDNTADLSYPRKAGKTANQTQKRYRKGHKISQTSKEIPSHLLENEKEIIDRCKKGDREAFNSLIRKHEKKVFNLCFRILGNRHEAQDVAQDVFVTVFKAINSFRGDSAFSTWVHRVAVNNCKNRIKFLKRRRYFRTESMEQTYDTGESEISREFGDDEGISPEEALENAELGSEIQEAIGELDEDYRVVIVLRDIQGFSYQEISETLDLKEGTVKSRIHRARMELKEKLEHLI